MNELNEYRKIMSDLPEGIREAEAEAEKNDRMIAGKTNGEETGMSASDKTVLFVRASGTKTGMTYTQNLLADPREVVLEAFCNSEFVNQEKTELFHREEKDACEEEQVHCSLDQLLSKASELEEVVKSVVPKASHIAVKVSENMRTM